MADKKLELKDDDAKGGENKTTSAEPERNLAEELDAALVRIGELEDQVKNHDEELAELAERPASEVTPEPTSKLTKGMYRLRTSFFAPNGQTFNGDLVPFKPPEGVKFPGSTERWTGKEWEKLNKSEKKA